MFLGKTLHNQLTDNYAFDAIRTFVASSTVMTAANQVVTNYNSVYDPFSNFSSGAYTVDADGTYFLRFWISTNMNYVWEYYIRKGNGTRLSETAVVQPANWEACHCVAVAELEAGDTVEVYHTTHFGSDQWCRYQFTGTII